MEKVLTKRGLPAKDHSCYSLVWISVLQSSLDWMVTAVLLTQCECAKMEVRIDYCDLC